MLDVATIYPVLDEFDCASKAKIYISENVMKVFGNYPHVNIEYTNNGIIITPRNVLSNNIRYDKIKHDLNGNTYLFIYAKSFGAEKISAQISATNRKIIVHFELNKENREYLKIIANGKDFRSGNPFYSKDEIVEEQKIKQEEANSDKTTSYLVKPATKPTVYKRKRTAEEEMLKKKKEFNKRWKESIENAQNECQKKSGNLSTVHSDCYGLYNEDEKDYIMRILKKTYDITYDESGYAQIDY